MSEARIDA